MKKVPLGISTFSEIIECGYIYVDKTQATYKMVNTGKTYFLSRPRRFGKSLLVSTLKSLFNADEELFENLYIKDKWNWNEKYPVFHLDLGTRKYQTPKQLENSLTSFINRVAKDFSIELFEDSLPSKFNELISTIHLKTGKKLVVLIDEYDKPIIDCISNTEIANKNQKVLNDFYQILKASDEYLRFIFITGVTKFSKTSIFSGLNNLDDITLDSAFSTICGYTQEELESCFKEHIANFCNEKGIGKEEFLSLIKQWYDGYSWDGNNQLYNPYSIISLFKKGVFRNYWFETGTPSFLMDFIKNNPEDLDVLFIKKRVIEGDFPDFDLEYLDLTTLLLQTGYLTIKKEKIQIGELPNYELAIPNQEVEISLFSSIIRYFSKKKSLALGSIAEKILESIVNLDSKSLQNAFDILVATIPGILYGKIKHDIREANFHIWFLSWFRLMGFLCWRNSKFTRNGRFHS